MKNVVIISLALMLAVPTASYAAFGWLMLWERISQDNLHNEAREKLEKEESGRRTAKANKIAFDCALKYQAVCERIPASFMAALPVKQRNAIIKRVIVYRQRGSVPVIPVGYSDGFKHAPDYNDSFMQEVPGTSRDFLINQ